MIGDMSELISHMIGTLAVILLIAAFIGSSDIIERFVKSEKNGNIPLSPGFSAAFSEYTAIFPALISMVQSFPFVISAACWQALPAALWEV